MKAEIVNPPENRGGKKLKPEKTSLSYMYYTSDKSGLSTCHILPSDSSSDALPSFHSPFFVEFAVSGSYCALVSKVSKRGVTSSTSKRGRITGFSRRSRSRLMRLLAQVDRSHQPLFVTLTYPAEFAASSVVWKRQLCAFYKRLVRRFGEVAFIWKLEFQRRGAPHFHLLLWLPRQYSLQVVRQFVSYAWFAVVKSGDIKHLRAGTRVEVLRSWRSVLSYASKYLAKEESAPEGVYPGRFWGVLGRRFLPLSDICRVFISRAAFFRLRRVFARKLRISLRAFDVYAGLWCMLSAKHVMKLLELFVSTLSPPYI